MDRWIFALGTGGEKTQLPSSRPKLDGLAEEEASFRIIRRQLCPTLPEKF